MHKNKIKKMILALTVALGITTMASGCTLVTVNPERDNAQIIAEIDGQPLTKDHFNNYMAYYEMINSTNGAMPTGSELKELKKDIFDNLMQTEAMAAKAVKDGEKIDEAARVKEGEESLKSLKETVEKKYDSILKNNNTNDESFTAFMKNLAVKNAYASAASSKYLEDLEAHPEKELDLTVGKINGEEIKKGEYNYYALLQQINNAMLTQQGAAVDTSSDQMNEEIFDAMAKNKALIKYCEDNGIEITDEAIRSAQTTKQSSLSTVFSEDSQLNSYLEQYYLSREAFDEYQKADAKATAAGMAIEKKMQEDAKVSDGAVQKYFKEHSDEYSESTVSAQHILTEDENLAKEIYEKAKGIKTKEDFQKLMDQYQNNDQVKEAADLGAFNKEKMVTEFSDAAFSMDKNTVSEPVKTEFGYHVIFVYDKKDSGTPSLDDYREEIRQTLKEEKGSEEYAKFVEKLGKDQKIEIGEIKTPLESFMDSLKEELNMTINEKVIS